LLRYVYFVQLFCNKVLKVKYQKFKTVLTAVDISLSHFCCYYWTKSLLQFSVKRFVCRLSPVCTVL